MPEYYVDIYDADTQVRLACFGIECEWEYDNVVIPYEDDLERDGIKYIEVFTCAREDYYD